MSVSVEELWSGWLSPAYGPEAGLGCVWTGLLLGWFPPQRLRPERPMELQPGKQANGGEEVNGKEERKATAGRTEEGRAAEGCRLGGGGLARLGFLTRNKWRRGVG